MAQKDLSEKALLSFNDVFADICNAFLYDGKFTVRPENLQDSSTEQVFQQERKLTSTMRDVTKTFLKRKIRIAQIGFENQTKPDRFMPIRVMLYDCLDYRKQCIQTIVKRKSCSLTWILDNSDDNF